MHHAYGQTPACSARARLPAHCMHDMPARRSNVTSRHVTASLHARTPASPPARQPARQPAMQPACPGRLPASPPARLPASPPAERGSTRKPACSSTLTNKQTNKHGVAFARRPNPPPPGCARSPGSRATPLQLDPAAARGGNQEALNQRHMFAGCEDPPTPCARIPHALSCRSLGDSKLHHYATRHPIRPAGIHLPTPPSSSTPNPATSE